MKKCLSMALMLIMLLCLMPTTSVFAASVTIVDAVNIELPVAEEKPDFSADLHNWSNAHKITGVEWVEYDEGWEWEKDMSANDTFKEGYWYVVYVHFETTSGNNFSETINPYINNETAQISGPAVQANRTKVSIYKAYQATKAPTAISKVDLNVVKPVVGKTPTFAKVDTTQYFSEKYGTVSNCSNGVTWTNQDSGVNITVSNPFKEGTKYKVTYYLTAKDGYKFTTATQCTINGAAATIELTDNYHAKVSLSNLVPGDDKKEITSLDLTVVKPVVGKTPTFAKVDTTQYFSEKYGTVSNCSNGVTWTNQSSGVNLTVSNLFKEETKYTVTYYLTAKDGYKFTTATQCTINGAAATIELTDNYHAKVSLKNIIPDDGKKEVSSVSIYITDPKDGEKPNYTKIDGEEYYSDNASNGTSTKIYKNGIAWYKSASSYISPGTTETFKAGTEYTVKLSLVTKDGYKFAENVTAKLNGKTATVESFDDGSITISAKLTALNKEHTHTASSTWQYDDTEHWKICSDKNCGALVGEKQMHANSDADGKCDICGYQLTIEAPEDTTTSGDATTDPTQKPTDSTNKPTDGTTEEPTDGASEPSDSETTGAPSTDGNSEQTDNADKNNGALLWIILGVVIVIAVGAAITIVILKKKRAKKVDD